MSGGRLAGRSAIVTGAAQGIGAHYARALAAEGAAVLLADVLDATEAAASIRAAGGRAAATRVDVADPASAAAMAEAAVREHGGIDILVNNAAVFGTLSLQPMERIDGDEWDRVMRVNVRGPFECTRAVLPEMRRRGYGKVVNVASGTAFKGVPYFLHYVASKGAVLAMTRAMARELGGDGIRVNTLAPGLVLSENVLANPTWSEEFRRANTASRALKRESVPQDLVGALLFLCSPDSDFMTGETVVVDGGSVMH